MRFLANRLSVTLSAHKVHRSCILLHSPNWAVWTKVADFYRNVYYTSPLTLKLEKNIPAHLSVIYPRKKKAKVFYHPLVSVSYAYGVLLQLKIWFHSKLQKSSLKYLSVGSHYIWCLFLTKKDNLDPCSIQ